MLFSFIKLIRIPQWIKNLFVFVPLVFSKHLFDKDYLISSLIAFLIFCLISSIVYVINDIADVESDRLHPKKKSRPIAAGKINTKQAISKAAVLRIPRNTPIRVFPMIMENKLTGDINVSSKHR